ncbi:hypothetical protein pb186bvf_004446 [Paramecium bursaria]
MRFIQVQQIVFLILASLITYENQRFIRRFETFIKQQNTSGELLFLIDNAIGQNEMYQINLRINLLIKQEINHIQ